METVETYTPGYSCNASAFMARRTARTHAAFLLPYLNSTMSLLDCGCGPGTITAELATVVAEVTAMDREPSQLALAKRTFDDGGLENVVTRLSSVYEIPAENKTFDVVFGHALFEHLSGPTKALAEIKRVLKPSGLIALRSPDWGGFLISPASPELQRGIDRYKQLQVENGGDVYVGRNLKALLIDGGFQDVKVTGSYEVYEPLEPICEYLAQRLETCSHESKSQPAAALRCFAKDPKALFMQAWCEAIGRKAP